MSYQQNPYSPSAPQAAGHQESEANRWGVGRYEMQPLNNQQPVSYQQHQPPQQQYHGLSESQFLDQVQALRGDMKDLNQSLDELNKRHKRSLADRDAKDQFSDYRAEVQRRRTAIQDGVRRLEDDLARTSPSDKARQVKKRHLQTLKTPLQKVVEKYVSVEQDIRNGEETERIRQLGLVHQDWDYARLQEEARRDWGDEGVFQDALMNNRTEQATEVLGNVRARHMDLQRLEKDTSELALLFQELATMVEQQEETVVATEQHAEHTVDNMEAGNQQVKVATDHARRARKLKWWCLLLVVIIFIVVALGVALGICLNSNRCSSGKK
ncbi:t-SNARE [Metarhizium album ARSEF 1941]|uniref:t-SNARE n=1 Tax=Metarhizium album (strain ARSEF 1941) TaxID=1081103 RepID=A0A0B2WNL0_METAS|nr:t-SNARE [Metarhizium album ARSEF 1941]KHN95077.1 t-SNARE [Metarhizium album ARSEF 1941]